MRLAPRANSVRPFLVLFAAALLLLFANRNWTVLSRRSRRPSELRGPNRPDSVLPLPPLSPGQASAGSDAPSAGTAASPAFASASAGAPPMQDNLPTLRDNLPPMQDNLPPMQDNLPTLQDFAWPRLDWVKNKTLVAAIVDIQRRFWEDPTRFEPRPVIYRPLLPAMGWGNFVYDISRASRAWLGVAARSGLTPAAALPQTTCCSRSCWAGRCSCNSTARTPRRPWDGTCARPAILRQR
jgi:hypothetical protein